ncbi:MAG: histidinol-phosphate transaminase [Rhodospirillaceae bacterium]|nr:histidinol-phosphate transaminase [Rhodospirillaceae bacterium]
MTPPTPRPGIMELEPYVGGKSSLPGIKQVIKLASNESALGPSPRAVAAYTAMAERMYRYPDGAAADLRQALARHHGLDAKAIVCGNGSDELLAMLAKAYAGPGDEVLYSQYGFVMYPVAALAAGARPVTAPETHYCTDVDALLAKVGPKTKIVFLANPNNPTGSYLTDEEVRRLHAKLPENVLLVIDAAYAEFVRRNDYEPGIQLVSTAANVVMTRTFSKIYAMGGLRLGWVYCPPAIADVLNRVRPPFNVNSAAQAAAIAALDDVAFTDRARVHNDTWRDWLTGRLRDNGFVVSPSVGNFVLVHFDREGRHTAAAANRFLNERGIIVRALEPYGLLDALRITIGREDEMQAVATALAAFRAR